MLQNDKMEAMFSNYNPNIATTGFFSFFFVKKKELNSKNVSTNNFYNFCIINMKNIFGFINTED